MSTTTTPPFSHIIDPQELKVGDHIYRRLSGWKKVFGFHHGIVTVVHHDEYNINKIKITEMTKKHGVRESTLPIFLAGDDCRLVYYNTSKFYETLHRAGTCHSEPKSDTNLILKRCAELRKIYKDIASTYSLYGLNCEHFALFCATGRIHSNITLTQIKNILHKAEEGAHCCHKAEMVNYGAHHGSHHTTINAAHHTTATVSHHTTANVSQHAVQKTSVKLTAKCVGKCTGKCVASNASSITNTTTATVIDGSKEVAKKTVSNSTMAIGVFVGIAAGLEVLLSVYRCIEDIDEELNGSIATKKPDTLAIELVAL